MEIHNMTIKKHFFLTYCKPLFTFFCMVSFCSVFSASLAHAEEVKGKTLLIYYSWGGNTEKVATQIANAIDTDVIKLETVDAYPKEYRPTTVQAKKEQQAGYRPALSTKVPPLDGYDNIILGTPNWWGTFAMPMFTLLDGYDLAGKNVTLFITHGGSRFGRSLDDLKALAPKAHILEGLALSSGSVDSAQEDIRTWLQKIGFTLKQYHE